MEEIAQGKGANNATFLFSFERDFDENAAFKYMYERWTDSLIFSAIYVVVVFGGKKIMEKRQRYELRTSLAVWSTILAVFSIVGTIRTLPEMISVVSQNGLQYSMCVPSYFNHVPANFWSYMFTISKVYELGDTIFIVLRKQKLIFLHWYHHVTVLIYCFYGYGEHTAPGRWFMVMNYIVHSIMYSYFALRAFKFNIPKWVNMFITSLQLVQMIAGVIINISVFRIRNRGEFCQISYENMYYAFFMYFTYLLLFAEFFYTTYIVKKPATENVQKRSEEREKKQA